MFLLSLKKKKMINIFFPSKEMVGVVAQSFPKKSYKMKKSLAPQKKEEKEENG